MSASKAVAIDVGTMFFQTAEGDPYGEMEIKTVRNAFIELAKTEDIEQMLEQKDGKKLQYVEDAKSIYVIGEDAIRFARMLPGKVELRRPLQNGVLNADEEMKNAVLNELIKSSIGKAPDKKSVAVTCVSSPPADASPTNGFHEKRLRGMFENLGWHTVIVQEALAVILAENPTTVDSEGNKLVATGIAVSFGAGRVNIVLTYKGAVTVGMSAGRSGDWIDREVAAQINVPLSTVTSFKESKLDFNNINDDSDLEFALDVYYGEMLKYVFNLFAEKFKGSKDADKFNFPLDVVLAGGTSMPKGFVGKAERVIRSLELPFEVREIRHAADPRNAVVKGLLAHATITAKRLAAKDSADEILKG